MQLVMPDLDALVAIRATRPAAPNARIIALTSFHVDETVIQALHAGAISYLIKDIDVLGLVEAMRAAHAGRCALCEEAVQALVKNSTGRTAVVPRGQERTPRGAASTPTDGSRTQ